MRVLEGLDNLDTILSAKRITKNFPGVIALDGVDFSCLKGEVHALVGENGAGKSTLMKILAGIYQPNSGELYFKGSRVETFSPQHAQRLGIGLIHQELSLLPYMSVAENIFLGREPLRSVGLVDFSTMGKGADQILSQLDGHIDPQVMVYRLSPAQRQLVEIAKALSLNPEVMIMDEPTSSLAENELERLFEIINLLRGNGVTVIYISHRLEEILEIADQVTVLRDGKTMGTLPIQAVDRQKLIRMMVGRDIEVEAVPRQHNPGDVLLEVKGLTRKQVFRDIHLEMRKGEILGLAGLVGAGRTELARAIFGADPVDAGSVLLNGQPLTLVSPAATIEKGVALVPEDRKGEGLILAHSVRENISLPSLKKLQRMGLVDASSERKMVGQSVRNMDIQTPGVEQQVVYLSGGNQQKVVLAKWLNIGPQVIIFDEPTRGIDVGAKTEIHHMIRELADAGKAVLMISSELPEILNLSDRIVVMSGGQIAGELSSNQATEESVLALAYQNLAEKRASSKEKGQIQTAPASPPAVPLSQRILRRLTHLDLNSNMVFVILLALVITGMLGSDRFLSVPNLTNVLRQMVIPLLLATGQTLVILSGGIDLSVSAVVTLSNVFAAGLMMGKDERLLPVALLCLGIGLLVGAINALVVIKLRVIPIIATLGTMVIGQGIALIYTHQPIGILPRSLYSLANASLGSLPFSTIWLTIIILLVIVLLYRSIYGRHLYAVGGDIGVARLSGIAVERVRMVAYLLSGLLAAATGLYLTSRMGSGDPTVGPGLELDSIAAVLLGGTVLGGGRGSLMGTIAGVIVLVLVGNVFNQLGLRIWHQQVAKGIIIILAVALYRLREQRA